MSKATTTCGASEIRAQVERILASPEFASSGRLRAFLQYAVEKTLSGEAGDVKESVIGVEVFKREASYDPRIDPVVRVMAGRLRLRLSQYYEESGANADIVIEFPKGSYVPQFRARGAPLPRAELDLPYEPSLAVLPLENMSADADQEYFADGMTEAIIMGLSKATGLRVISRTSVMRFKRTAAALPDIARQLNVDHVMEGSVLRDGDRVRVTAQLIALPLERHVWAESYERDLKDILGLQSEIARNIAAEVHVRLGAHENLPDRQLDAIDREAYLVYLKACFQARKGNADAFRKSLDLFEDVIRREPSFAPAHAGLAESCAILARYEYRRELLPRAKAAALKALELDGNLTEAQVSMASILIEEWRWAEAGQVLRAAIQTGPNYAAAHQLYGELLMRFGQPGEGLGYVLHAHSLDPLSPIVIDGFGLALYRARNNDEAIRQLKSAVDLHPEFYPLRIHLGVCYISAGRADEALVEFETAQRLSQYLPDATGLIGWAHASAGREAEALDCIRVLEDRVGRGEFVGGHTFAHIYRELGRVQDMLTWLEKSFEQRTFLMEFLRVDPFWDGVRDEPRFQALIDRLPLDA